MSEGCGVGVLSEESSERLFTSHVFFVVECFGKVSKRRMSVRETCVVCGSYLALELGLVREALEADLVKRIGRVAVGFWEVCEVSRVHGARSVGARSGKDVRQRSAGAELPRQN